jgi:hypothetical protein
MGRDIEKQTISARIKIEKKFGIGEDDRLLCRLGMHCLWLPIA